MRSVVDGDVVIRRTSCIKLLKSLPFKHTNIQTYKPGLPNRKFLHNMLWLQIVPRYWKWRRQANVGGANKRLCVVPISNCEWCQKSIMGGAKKRLLTRHFRNAEHSAHATFFTRIRIRTRLSTSRSSDTDGPTAIDRQLCPC